MAVLHTTAEPAMLLSATLSYARLGFRVVPIHTWVDDACTCGKPECDNPAKHPLTPHGLSDGTTDEAAIERWWSEAPIANVAICTGPESGVWMLGPDTAEGLRQLEDLQTKHGALPTTSTELSGSGGVHYYFRWPADGLPIKNAQNIGGLKIDVRGTGGYSICAPSINKNGAYRWTLPPERIPPAMSPDWLVEFVRNPDEFLGQGKPAETNGHVNGKATTKLVVKAEMTVADRLRLYLAKAEPAISGQNGHNQLFKACCKAVLGFNLTPEEAYPVVAEWNQGNVPPFLDKDVRRKLEEANKQDGERGFLLGDDLAPATVPIAGTTKATTITNVSVVGQGDKKKVVAMPMVDLLASIKSATGDWPRSVSGSMFVHHGDDVSWLDGTSAFFGWLNHSTGPVRWHKLTGGVTKEECFAEIRRNARKYVSVEVLPHLPPLADHYYTCSTPAAGNGKALRRLIDRFSPETDIDRDLIEANIATCFWGGSGGTRPAFVYTADQGRGVGKSKAATLISRLAGGFIDISQRETIEVIKARLLTPEALSKRVALLDNVKSLRFSWSELEALITSPTINGKRMYHGDATRANNLLWLITLNGASLSTDLSQRSVIVKLTTPKRSGSWEEETAALIDDERQAIIADVVAFFQRPATPLAKFTRWASWEKAVLSRLPEPSEAQKVIGERQGESDVEAEEAGVVAEFFAEQLAKLRYDPTCDEVHVPSAIAARWFGWATNDPKIKVVAASRMLTQLYREGRLPTLSPNACHVYGRGFVWRGPKAGSSVTTDYSLQERVDEANRRD